MKTWNASAVTLATEELRERIAGKKIALMMNTTALDHNGRLLIDVIAKEKWAEVAFFFGMEHGVRGNLYGGNGKLPDIDEKTGIRIVNLYEYPGLKPPVEWVRRVDAVVFCAQDVGVRHWTYTPWLMLLMESCAEAGVEVIVLDRPNPIRGDIVEGAPADPKYAGTKLLSGFEYPLRHGMTVGELACMFNEAKGIGAALTVLKMKGWRRDMWYDETGLPWVPGSPNMPTTETPLFFAATGLLQGSNLSIGIGTTTPFQYVGNVGLDGDALTEALNALDLPGIYFVNKFYMSKAYPSPEKDSKGEILLCDGAFMVISDRNAWRPVETQLHIMETVSRLCPEIDFDFTRDARNRMCTDKICDCLGRHESLLPIMEEWRIGAEAFKKEREKYLLY